ncbi:hypothetical protein QU481_23000 [Crenobacter sp. SG2303]|uniref:Transposase n=1 Tax=Crenobacter oryzisoli TaxID=3056844 RepID=A0ABT7XV59_9NEIS|nr:hypothetical protein [Crenobacter sp. SG2303]MDN0077686.1 hypothetical protein [Crenobacter sp. SG2303]
MICEAVIRLNMSFVPAKQAEQSALLVAQRTRASFIKARTAQTNQLRGLLAEFGITIPGSLASLQQRLSILLAEAGYDLPGMMRELNRPKFLGGSNS